MTHSLAGLWPTAFRRRVIIIGFISLFAAVMMPAFASAASLSIKDQVTTNIQYYFPIFAKSWNVPDNSMFTGFTGQLMTSTATNDFNIALMRIMQSPKGSACPPTNSWWSNSYGDWNALAAAFPNVKNYLGNGILKRPDAGSATLPMNYSMPSGYGVPIDGCVWAMLNGSALISGGNYTMGADLQLQYETGTAAAALTPLQTIPFGDEQCYMLNGCSGFNTYDNSMQFINVQKFTADTALHAINGNSGHSTFPSSPFLNWFYGTPAAGSWSVTDDYYVVPQCSSLSSGRQTASNWELQLPANKQLIYTRTLGSTGMAVKQDPINKMFSPVIKIPAGGCLVHLVKRTGNTSLNSETQVVLFTQPKFAAKNISISIPTTMEAGKTYPVTVVMRNDGFETWATSTNDRLGLFTGGDNVWGWTRSNVPSSIPARGTATFTFNVKATTTPGTYKFSARMLRESVQWIGPETIVSVTVITPSTPVPPVVNFSVTPSSALVGSNATATWSTTGATSCTASGSWSGTKAVSGSETVALGSVAGTKTYTLTCTGAGGTTAKSATVTVTASVPTLTFSVSPASASVGSNATATWSSTNVTSCTAAGSWSGAKAVSGTETIALGTVVGTKTYTLTCTGAGGSVAKSATVTVTTAVAPKPIGNFDGLKAGTTEPTLYGWAYDPKASSTSISVHIYVDGQVSGNFAGAVTANVSRPDVNVAFGITGQHGWEWVVPSQYRNGSHTYYIYGINVQSGGGNPQLSGSPKTFTIWGDNVPPPPPRPVY